MKIAFHHEPFDIDVSSGTIHAAYQWYELLNGFGITEAAVIGDDTEDFSKTGSDITIHRFATLDEFTANLGTNMAFVEHGGQDFREANYFNTDWLVFGGTSGLPRADISLPTNKGISLYPREAAAIVLARALWP